MLRIRRTRGNPMKVKQTGDRLSAVEQARRELRCVPIPWYEFELAAVEVSNANPGAKDRALVELIMTAALEQWSSGMGCC